MQRLRGEPVRKDDAGGVPRRWEDLIDALARQFEPKLAAAFRDAAATLGSGADIDALAAAVAAGDIQAVLAAVGLPPTAAPFASMQPLLVQIAQAGANAAIQAAPALLQAPVIAGARVSFDLLNPNTIEHLRSYSFNLLKQMADHVREGVREAMGAGMAQGIGPKEIAREIRATAGFGLTAQQSRAVANFRAELQSMDRAKLQALLRGEARLLRDKRFDASIRNALAGKAPLTQAQIDKMVDRYRDRMHRHRALNIARTEAIRAANIGAHEAMRQAEDGGVIPVGSIVRRWVVSKDERTCPICLAIPKKNPNGVGLRQPFQTSLGAVMLPPAHMLCVAGETRVASGSRILAVSQRRYEGEVVVVTVAGSDPLTITPNHPVLTPRGWVSAGALQEGDHVIRSARPDWMAGGVHHDHDMPSRIAEVAEAFGLSGKAAAFQVPVSAPDFHGDGAGSEVGVVWADRSLLAARDAALREQARQRALEDGRVGAARLSGSGDTALRFVAAGAAAAGGMCRRHLLRALSGVHGGPFEALLLAGGAQAHAHTIKGASDGGAADAELARQIVYGLTGPVEAAQVIRVRRAPFCDHVYNLETVRSHYYANGLVVHNCRCTVTHRLRADAIDNAA